MICYHGAVRLYAWEMIDKKVSELISKRNKADVEEFGQQCDAMWELRIVPGMDRIIKAWMPNSDAAFKHLEHNLGMSLAQLRKRCLKYFEENGIPRSARGGVDSSSSAPPGRPKSWAGLDSNTRQRIRDLVDGDLGFGSQGGPPSDNVEELLNRIAAKLRKFDPEPERGDQSRCFNYASHLILSGLGDDAEID